MHFTKRTQEYDQNITIPKKFKQFVKFVFKTFETSLLVLK